MAQAGAWRDGRGCRRRGRDGGRRCRIDGSARHGCRGRHGGRYPARRSLLADEQGRCVARRTRLAWTRGGVLQATARADEQPARRQVRTALRLPWSCDRPGSLRSGTDVFQAMTSRLGGAATASTSRRRESISPICLRSGASRWKRRASMRSSEVASARIADRATFYSHRRDRITGR